MSTDADLTDHQEMARKHEAALRNRHLEAMRTADAVGREVGVAIELARQGLVGNELIAAAVIDGRAEHSLQQGIRAACLAREDSAATLILLPSIFRRLDRNHRLIWVAIGLLAYIAYRVS